jgi:PAS domain S-box-containing protein
LGDPGSGCPATDESAKPPLDPAQAALRESEERWRDVVERGHDGIVILQDGVVIFANDALTRMTGFSNQELIGVPFRAAEHEEQSEIADRVRRRFAGEDLPSTYEMVLVRKDGTSFTAEVSAGVISYDGAPADLVLLRDVSERRRAQEALRERELIFESLVAQARDSIALVDTETGRFIEFNDAACRSLGYARDEFAGLTIGDFDVEYPGDASLAKLAALSVQGEGVFETRHRRKDGEIREVRVSVGAVDVDRRPCLTAVWSDVTERKRAEESLRESEQRYRSLFEENSAVMLLIDPSSGGLIDVNAAACSWYGWSRDEMLTMRIDQVNTLPDDEVRAEMERACDRERRVFDFRHRRADGSVRDVEVFSGPIVLQGRTLLYSMVHDVTERKQAEEARRVSEALYGSIVSASPDDIAITDMEGCIVLTSPAGFAMFALGPEDDPRGRLLSEFIAPEDRERAAANVALMVEGRSPGLGEYVALRTDGSTFPIEVNGEVVRDVDGQPKGMVFVVRDVTERKRTERLLAAPAEILGIIAAPAPIAETAAAIVAALKRASGFDAVGLRLRQDDDFPFVASAGYSEEFIAAESTLTERSVGGGLCRNPDGSVSLECTCGLVISGSADPADPLFTAAGSAWTNDALPFLEAPHEDDSRLHPRDRCIRVGYRSIALVPLRAGEEILGLLHLVDRQTGRFTPDSIAFFEGLGASIGVALREKSAQDALSDHRELLESVIAGSGSGVWSWHVQTGETVFNERWAEIVGYTLEELAPVSIETWTRLCHPDDLKRSGELLAEHFAGRMETYECEARMRHKDGHWVWVMDRGKVSEWDPDGAPLRMTGTHMDITRRKQDAETLSRQALELQDRLLDTMKAMGAIVSLRDPYTAAHERRVTSLAVAIADELRLDDEVRQGLAFAGWAHDIGKISVPAEILSKPGALQPEEFAIVMEHSPAGREILEGIRFRQPVAEIVGQHHERLDGSGYPDGLRGEEILLEARILAVADVVEAMASDRPYRAGLGVDVALAEVRAGAGVRYDAEVVAACERVFAGGFVFVASEVAEGAPV